MATESLTGNMEFPSLQDLEDSYRLRDKGFDLPKNKNGISIFLLHKVGRY